jgi:hypothetical protein
VWYLHHFEARISSVRAYAQDAAVQILGAYGDPNRACGACDAPMSTMLMPKNLKSVIVRMVRPRNSTGRDGLRRALRSRHA